MEKLTSATAGTVISNNDSTHGGDGGAYASNHARGGRRLAQRLRLQQAAVAIQQKMLGEKQVLAGTQGKRMERRRQQEVAQPRTRGKREKGTGTTKQSCMLLYNFSESDVCNSVDGCISMLAAIAQLACRTCLHSFAALLVQCCDGCIALLRRFRCNLHSCITSLHYSCVSFRGCIGFDCTALLRYRAAVCVVALHCCNIDIAIMRCCVAVLPYLRGNAGMCA